MDPKPVVLGMIDNDELRHLMERLQQYLYRFRIRTKEFFLPYDQLRTGFVSANRFRRTLTDMGIGGTGRLFLTEAEYDNLINFYRCPVDTSKACWRKFEADIDSIFTQRELELMPSALPPPPDRVLAIPYPGATNMNDVPLRIRQLAKCAVARLKHRIFIESCNIKYFFQGFDITNNGYISRQQFKQTLSMLNYNFTKDELESMSVLYCDMKGFNYLKLMDDIEPKRADMGWYLKYKNERLYKLSLPPPNPKWKENDIQRIIYKIRAKMVRCRPQLEAFLRDHDLFNHDRIKIWDFHRAMDRASFELTPREMEVLTCCFRSPDDPTEIQYRCLNEAIENVFTLFYLEKAPRLVPVQWHPLREMDYDKELCPEEYCLLNEAMRRLAKRVYDRRLHIKPMFWDFDKPVAGLVSADQFHRVLHIVGLAEIVTYDELDVIMKRYQVIRGGKHDIDYVEFLTSLDEIPSISPVTLEELSPTGVAWYQQSHHCPNPIPVYPDRATFMKDHDHENN